MRSVCVIILAAVLIAPFTLRGQEPKKPQTPTTFVEVPPTQSRINWAHDNGRSEAHHLPETCGGGGVFFDYDNDGWMDIYLVNSGPSDFYSPGKPLKSALYHNNHDGTFTEVTDKAGVAANIFGMGAAASDYDGDGWVDLYVTGYDRSILYHNNSDGTFTDMTDKAGVAAPGWSTSAAWFDYDNDGKLDLFVSSFVEYSAKGTIFCGDNRLGRRYYCVPRVFKPRPSHLYHNEGNGKFKDVSKESGIANSLGKSFGVVATDVNNDGLLDLFVANDTVANFLFQNKGNGKFEEIGLAAGVAYSDSGSPRSGMGVDAADFDGDGWQDLFVANIDQELFSLYQNQHDLTFLDKPGEIGKATRLLSGWGLKFFDYDNDGSPDLILANGHPDDMVEIQSLKVKYKEPLLMFQNVKGTFKDVSSQSGAAFGKDWPARGLALGDYDNDGDLDVLIINNGEAPVLLKNEGGNNNNWVGLQLAATKSNPAAVGAIITWEAGGVKYRRLKTSGGSFLATHDPREILGIGKAEKIDSVEIKWPSGRIDKLTNLPLNKYVKVVEGEGKWQPYKM
ncbi:MAG TPA: CRTAC1 family protein [Pyrinomonadaceae bacterium]|nr:CRTAC1 family protein [Pyrinomonadaceae bacterium]